MKKLFVFTLCCLCAHMGMAQELFEGRIKARSYEYHSQSMIKYSKGTLQNGARDAEMYIKGNRLSSYDGLLNVQTIYDIDNDKVYFVFHEIATVLAMPATSFANAQETAIKPQATDETKTIGGLKCRKYEGTKEEAGLKISSTVWLCEELAVHEDLAPYVSGNTGLPLLGMKYIIDSTTKVLMMSMNSYTAFDIKEVVPCIVPDDKFVIPTNYKIVESSFSQPKKMLSVYSENEKALKKAKKLTPTDKSALKFDIDEEWDF